jgi:PAS domain S-box-containing protein
MGDTIVGTLGVNIDVTDRLRAEEERVRALGALRQSEEKLRLAVDATAIGLWSWDPKADVVAWEDPICAIFGLPAGYAPAGREGYVALIHPDDRARAADVIARGVQAGRWEDEHRILRADGAVRSVLTKGTVVRGDGRDLVLGALIDVTERRLRDDRLRETQKLEAVGQLTAGIAHNFNNMLMGILPNLELAAGHVPKEVEPLLQCAEHSAQRAAQLVRQLMTYAGRSRAGARRVETIGPLVSRAVHLCRSTFDKLIAFDVRIEGAAHARVDATQIEQAVVNILINARDALTERPPTEPRVTVEVDDLRAGAPELQGRVGDHVRIRIADNGVGMDAATRARIYEPFFTTKSADKGTGLGLAMTHTTVHEHGGFLVCKSAESLGTTFSLYLPCEAPDAERTPIAATPARGTETILVIDDEAPVRDVISRMLHSMGFATKVAASGEEALEILSDPRLASEVALALLDVSMPGMPGPQLRERLRSLAPKMRVVYFTGYAYEAADEADAVLEKPATSAQVARVIREVLDRRA